MNRILRSRSGLCIFSRGSAASHFFPAIPPHPSGQNTTTESVIKRIDGIRLFRIMFPSSVKTSGYVPEKEMVLVLGSDQAVNQDANRCSIGTKLMNVTRLMCSRDRQELETLKSKLSKAAIPSEIRYNPVAAERGITPFEIVVDERDLFRASKVHQGLETAARADDPRNTMRIPASSAAADRRLYMSLASILPDSVRTFACRLCPRLSIVTIPRKSFTTRSQRASASPNSRSKCTPATF